MSPGLAVRASARIASSVWWQRHRDAPIAGTVARRLSENRRWSGVRQSLWPRLSGFLLLLICLAVVGCYLIWLPQTGAPPLTRLCQGSSVDNNRIPQPGDLAQCGSILACGRPACCRPGHCDGHPTCGGLPQSAGRADQSVRPDRHHRVHGWSSSCCGPVSIRIGTWVGVGLPLYHHLMSVADHYVCLLLHYGSAATRTMVQTGLLILVCLAVPANMRFAKNEGEHHRRLYEHFERGMQAGVPLSRLVRSTSARELHPDSELMSRLLRMLKSARNGKYVHLNDDEPSQIAAGSPGSNRVIR